MLRNILLDIKPSISWPLRSDDLDSDDAVVPDILYNVLAWIFISHTEYCPERVTNLTNHVHRWILSLGQDQIYCVTRGCIKTPNLLTIDVLLEFQEELADLYSQYYQDEGKGPLKVFWNF